MDTNAPPQPPAQLVVRQPLFQVRAPRRDQRWLNALIYGDYGAGKTHLLGTSLAVPGMNDVLFLDIESGDLTLKVFPDMKVVPIRAYSDVNIIYQWLKRHVQARDAYLNGDDELRSRARGALVEMQQQVWTDYDGEEEPYLFRTVLIDSLSELQRYSMYQLLGVRVGAASIASDVEKAGWDEWGKSTEMIRLLVRTFREMPLHVIMACSEAMAASAEKKRSPISINLPKKLAEDVPGFFDLCGYLAAAPNAQTGVIERRLYVNAGQNFMAKNRFGYQKPFIEQPTMAKIMELVR